MRAILLVTGFWLMAGLMCVSAAQAAEPTIADVDQSNLAEKLARNASIGDPTLVQPCTQCRPTPVSDRGTIVKRVPGAIRTAQRGTTGIQSPETAAQPLVSDTLMISKIPGLTPSVSR